MDTDQKKKKIELWFNKVVDSGALSTVNKDEKHTYSQKT